MVKYHQGGGVALTVGSIRRGTIVDYIIFIGYYCGQPIQQPIKMKSFMIVPPLGIHNYERLMSIDIKLTHPISRQSMGRLH